MKNLSAMFLVIGLLASGAVRADMIEVANHIGLGAGTMAISGGRPLNVLLRLDVNPAFNTTGHDGSLVVVARMKGDLAIGEHGSVPYLDIDFTTLAQGFPAIGIRLLNGEITRDVSVDTDASFRVTAIGFWFDTTDFLELTNDVVLPFVRVAADALGYKFASHVVDGRGAFHGFTAADLEVELGLVFKLGYISRAKISVGGQTDVSFGANHDAGGSFRSDNRLFAQISTDISYLVRAYVRGQANFMHDTGVGADASSLQLLAGAEFRFY